MKLSVVIIFYNQAAYVRRALASVFSQTYENLDVVVVDDGSNDDTAAEISRFADCRIRFFRKENGGAASARNFGVREARGDYVAFLDGDDLFLPTKIERFVDFLSQKDWPVCVVTSGHYVISRQGFVVDRRNSPMDSTGNVHPFSEMYTSCSVYHRETIERFGGFPENLRINEDGALNAQISQRYPVYALAEPLTYYQVDNFGKARRSLQDYDWAVSVMEDRLRVVAQECDSQMMNEYRRLSERNLFYGFLSCGNMGAAKRWYMQVAGNIDSLLLIHKLAVYSVRSGINGYAGVRWFIRIIKMARYIPRTVAFRRMFF